MRAFIGFVGVVFLTLLSAATVPADERRELSRPNLVFLLADDLRFDGLHCTGNPVVQTPNLDQLAAKGVVFRNVFVTDSICACSRASFFTGQHVCRHKIDDFAKTFSPDAWKQTYPALLRQLGYRTGFIGKYGVGSKMPEKEFDYWRGFPGQGNYFDKGSKEHLTRRMGDQAVEFLRGATPGQPFCLSISFKAPHSQTEEPGREYPPDPRDEKLYAGMKMPVPPTVGEKFFQALPLFLQTSEGRLRWQRRKLDQPERYQDMLRNYYRLVTGMDREVGRIVAELRDLKLDSNTVIVFSSDNGYFLGGRGLVDKFFMYEESIRVPLIVFDPHVKETAGKTIDAMALNTDVAPTLLDYAEVPIPATMQGRSLRPLIDGKPSDWRKDWFYEHHYAHGGTIPPCEGVRGERWKYIRYYAATPVFEELYDLANDPLEQHNLAADAAHGKVLEELRRRWQEYRKELE